MSISYKLIAGKFYRKEEGILKRYSKGEIISFESKSNIPEAILPRLEPLYTEKNKEEGSEEIDNAPNVGLRIKKIADDKYNVINEVTQEPINDIPLKKEEAISLASDVDDILEIGGDNLDTIVIKDNMRRKKKNRDKE